MKIALAFDHAGIDFKEAIIKIISSKGFAYEDFGTFSTASCDYPDFGIKAAVAVADGKCEKGILVCGTGIGMSIAANKVDGIRCALCHDTFSAKATREHNNSNMLAMGARVIGLGLMEEIVNTWLSTEFSNDLRHINRINKVMGVEKK